MDISQSGYITFALATVRTTHVTALRHSCYFSYFLQVLAAKSRKDKGEIITSNNVARLAVNVEERVGVRSSYEVTPGDVKCSVEKYQRFLAV